MGLITIEVQPEVLLVHEGVKLPDTRLVWRADNLEVWVDGSMTDQQHQQARCLVMNVCEARHIPLMTLRDVTVKARKAKAKKTDTKFMFGDK